MEKIKQIIINLLFKKEPVLMYKICGEAVYKTQINKLPDYRDAQLYTGGGKYVLIDILNNYRAFDNFDDAWACFQSELKLLQSIN